MHKGKKSCRAGLNAPSKKKGKRKRKK